MADDRHLNSLDHSGLRSSPREDFNPLADDQYPQKCENVDSNEEDDEGHETPGSTNEDPDLRSNSEEELEYKTHSLQYLVTPPQPRLRRREKERSSMKGRSAEKEQRSYKELLINKRQQQPRNSVNVIKSEYLSNPALCNLTECDSDDNLDRDVKRERKRKESRDMKKKALSKLRLSDREEKRFSEEFELMAVSEGMDTVKLDGSGRFSHLKPRSMMPLSAECIAKRQVVDPPVCAKDREDFYAKFSVLINLGTEAKKDKEKMMSSAKRQISIEQEQRRSHLIDQIWIELQAYINDNVFPEEQRQNLKRERQKSEQVLDDINSFCFAKSAIDTHESFLMGATPGRELFRVNPLACHEDYREMVSRSVSASFYDVNLTDETVCLQGKALIQVQELLERLDHYESCYRCTAACENDDEKYRNPVFQRRVKCLNLWLNITCDLCQRLKLFGRTIGAYSRGVQWPLVNFEFPKPQPREFLASPRASIPNVLETEPTESENEEFGEEEGGVKEDGAAGNKDSDAVTCAKDKSMLSPQPKHVQFLCGDDSSDQTSPIGSPVSANHCSTPMRLSSPAVTSLTTTSVLSLSRASSELSLDDSRSFKSSIYRHYAEKCLRKMGLVRLNLQLKKLFHRSLSRAKEALERPKEACYSDVGAEAEDVDEVPPPSDTSPRPSLMRGSSLSQHGEWSSQFIEMGLPSFRPTYLFLVKIWLDVVHECMKLRQDQTPVGEPSFLSIRQLIRECKEVLKGACQVKQYYHFMVSSVMWDEQEAEAKLETDLADFDTDMRNMLDMYFNYLQSWIHQLQSLPEASLGMKSALEEEWTFTKGVCSYVIGGEAEAGKKFSSLASSLLSSIADFLDKGIDDNTRFLSQYDEDIDDMGDDLESGNYNDEYDGDENDNVMEKSQYKPEMKQNVQRVLRNFKELFNEARERASKALGFAKLLRKDLEIAADFNIAVTTKELYKKLEETNHVQVQAPVSAGYVMFVPGHVISDTRLILQLLNVTSGREDPEGAPGRDDTGYLLMLRCEGGTDRQVECPIWQGEVVHVDPTADTAIALSHIEVMGCLFVVTHSGTLSQQRKHFETKMGKTIQLVNEQTSCHQSIAESLAELKVNGVLLMEKVARAIQQVNANLNFNEVIQHEESILKLFRETMLKIYDFGFEYQRELIRLTSRDQKERQCMMTVAFAKDWMSFVSDRCERGKGTRPRWATQGLEFIALACEPKNIVYLPDKDFQDFQHRIHNCLIHIIGSLDNRTVGPGMALSRSSLDLPRSTGPTAMYRLTSCPESQSQRSILRSISGHSAYSEPPGHGHGHLSSSSISTPSTNGSDFFGDSNEVKPRSERLRRRIENLEKAREQMLQEKSIIGAITSRAQEPDLRMNVRRVKFRWQRGMKIGEGTFGKVYNAVNMDTGELMAMKEMKIQPNDQQSLKDLCDEIKNFEGINHKNLVKYFGVEVHRDEMLMFMEYCDTGSLEEVARAGLSEYIIRRYTHEIVQAVAHLHENNIVHRDIKGANIFLTSQGQVKLGDFGCSVKLKNTQTMPGENVNLVGSTAYMAPEVIKQEGYGRAADIWSLGCVVIEMTTGKRPWHELEHNIQIMFKVGMGSTPPVPDSLCKEGKQFLHCCLTREVSKRWTAQQLLDHIFVKYYDDVEEVDEKDERAES